ncbi:hypothetical protein Ancab_010059 [Ancistrocladus abbreviatus]
MCKISKWPIYTNHHISIQSLSHHAITLLVAQHHQRRSNSNLRSLPLDSHPHLPDPPRRRMDPPEEASANTTRTIGPPSGRLPSLPKPKPPQLLHVPGPILRPNIKPPAGPKALRRHQLTFSGKRDP